MYSDKYELFYAKAKAEMGVAEAPGKLHNKRVLEYHKATTLKASDDETPWCSSFANWVVAKCGVVGTGSAAARSWLKWGSRLATPTRGCIAVFSRTGGGHVAFFDHKDEKFIYCLGGNQGNRVCIAAYPVARLLEYRG